MDGEYLRLVGADKMITLSQEFSFSTKAYQATGGRTDVVQATGLVYVSGLAKSSYSCSRYQGNTPDS